MHLFYSSILWVLVGALIWRAWYELRAYRVTHYMVTLRKPLSRSLKILHLSDLHFGGPCRPLERFFDRLATDHYDFIFITGDILDYPEGIPYCADNLKKLRAKEGMYAVFGNHDYYIYDLYDLLFHNFPGQTRPKRLQPTHQLRTVLEEIGIKVINNETSYVHSRDHEILIHGLDDATTGRANVRKAMMNFDPAKINILLTHNIDVFLDIGRDEIDLSFSGHTHGGQIFIPGLGAIYTHTRLGRPYAQGIKKLKGAVCCVSRGLGCGRWVPIRLLCRPEAVVVNVFGA